MKRYVIKKQTRATEELTSDASVTDFVAELSKYAADFIRNNRTAFADNDEEAVQELINVFSVQTVREGILSALQVEPAEEDSLADEVSNENKLEETEQKDNQAKEQPKEQNDDLVSDDVMALLDE